jgi:hypothetical protein
VTHLTDHDIYWCVRKLPAPIFELLKEHGHKLCVAGGFIRSAISNEPVSDVDLFTSSKDLAGAFARSLGRGATETDNAFTVKLPAGQPPAQFIHRWTFDRPQDVVPSFDFTIARAAIWYNHQLRHWESLCDDRFYPDLAAKRLVYCSPLRNEDAGGSMLRVLKFYQRGYRIPLESLAAVISRLVQGIDEEAIERATDGGATREGRVAFVVCGLLREVDPAIDPNHLSHLPTATEPE